LPRQIGTYPAAERDRRLLYKPPNQPMAKHNGTEGWDAFHFGITRVSGDAGAKVVNVAHESRFFFEPLKMRSYLAAR